MYDSTYTSSNTFTFSIHFMSADLVQTKKLKQRQLKIQEKRKKTEWRDFLMEIASWRPLTFHKNQWMISIFPPTDRHWSIKKIIDIDWDLFDWDIKESWDFFDNLNELFLKNPLPNVIHYNENPTALYADQVHFSNNVYLSCTVTVNSDNVLYSYMIRTGENIVDAFNVNNSQEVFMSSNISSSRKVFYSNNIHNSADIWWSANLYGCTECIDCSDLQNMSYCIKNQKLEKAEYFKQKHEYLKQKGKSKNMILSKNINSENVDWIGIVWSSDVENWYHVINTNWWRNLFAMWSSSWNKHMYDFLNGWAFECSHFYWWVNAGGWDHYYCTVWCGYSSMIFYCYHMNTCSFCLWCIWLKNKSYCIFNKQYTKDERYDEVDKMFTKMEKDWQLWEFFPGSMNPFYFNDTAAYLIDPSFTKEEVTAKWYLRRDEPIKVDIPVGSTLVSTADLDQYEWFDSEGNRTINADILKVVIQDEQENYYRIIPMEYKFLVKHGLPLPRKHRLERMKDNFKIA